MQSLFIRQYCPFHTLSFEISVICRSSILIHAWVRVHSFKPSFLQTVFKLDIYFLNIVSSRPDADIRKDKDSPQSDAYCVWTDFIFYQVQTLAEASCKQSYNGKVSNTKSSQENWNFAHRMLDSSMFHQVAMKFNRCKQLWQGTHCENLNWKKCSLWVRHILAIKFNGSKQLWESTHIVKAWSERNAILGASSNSDKRLILWNLEWEKCNFRVRPKQAEIRGERTGFLSH